MQATWKLWRELDRLGQQLRGVTENFTDPLQQKRLDKLVAAGLPCVPGHVPLTDRVALFLIFQPGGLSASTFATLRWLAGLGYAPLVVSNAPLLPADREALQSLVWRAVVRPNFGYDFGGYRDGLTLLEQWSVRPDELLILNDSIWLPVLPESDLAARLAAEPAEVAGTILRKRGEERFLESYLYRLRRPALEHPAFRDYWSRLRLTSNKYYVIRRGERGFSAAMRAAGLRVAGVYDTETAARHLAEQDDDFLHRTLEHAAYIDPHLQAERDHLLASRGRSFRSATVAHVGKVLEKRQLYSSFPYASVQLMGYPVLKKSAEPISRAWRQAHLHAIEAGELHAPPPPILSEVQSRDAAR